MKDVQLQEPSLEKLIKFGSAEVKRMQRFGEMYGAEVFIAIYIADFPMWLLVSGNDLVEGPGGGYRISVRDAIFKNKLAMIGDQSIGVRAPLEASFLPAPGTPTGINEEGEAPFTIGAVHLYSGGTLVTSPEARRIVWFFMMYGGWEQDEHVMAVDGRVTELRWTSSPPEESRQGFGIVGSLSSMYSRLFESSTNGPRGYTALDLNVEPGTLITLLPHDFRDDELPLWRFTLVPTNPEDGEK